jgi:DNA-binding NarL/FixJ family response regulator
MVHGVLVVDDHDDVRTAIVSMLTAGGFHVVGEASNAEEALDTARREEPSVVLLDIRLPGPDGFAVARDLCGLTPPPTVVLMSSHEARVYARELERSAVRGFIAKHDLSAASLRHALGDVSP